MENSNIEVKRRNSSLFLLSIEILQNLSALPGWKEDYYDIITTHFPQDSPSDIVRKVCQQGATLCLLVNILQKNTIALDEITSLEIKSESPFDNKKTRSNVNLFLMACKDQLFIPSDELFLNYELYNDDLSGIVKVK